MKEKIREKLLGELQATVAANVRALRARRRLSQGALAEAIGRERGCVHTLEAEKNMPTLETLCLIAAALDTTVSELTT